MVEAPQIKVLPQPLAPRITPDEIFQYPDLTILTREGSEMQRAFILYRDVQEEREKRRPKIDEPDEPDETDKSTRSYKTTPERYREMVQELASVSAELGTSICYLPEARMEFARVIFDRREHIRGLSGEMDTSHLEKRVLTGVR